MLIARGLFVVLLGSLVACETSKTQALKPEPQPEPPTEPEANEADGSKHGSKQAEPEPPAKRDACVPPGSEGASKLETIPIPSGCKVEAAGDLLAPTVVRGLDELAAAIQCEPGSELPTVDFAKQQLHVATFMLSPAYAGSELLDDGKTVTFVQRDRSPCPGDPQPMPIGSSIAYLLPTGAERAYAQFSCPLPPKCD